MQISEFQLKDTAKRMRAYLQTNVALTLVPIYAYPHLDSAPASHTLVCFIMHFPGL